MNRLACVVIMNLLACKSEGERAREIIEKNKAKGTAQLQRLNQVYELAAARPPLEADAASFPLANVDFRSHQVGAISNGAFVSLLDLTQENLRSWDGPGPLGLYAPFFVECSAWFTPARTREPRYDPDTVDAKVREFLAVHWLGVIRTVELKEPVATEDGGVNGGHHRFELLFYELTSPPNSVGGVRLVARGSEPPSLPPKGPRVNQAVLSTWRMNDLKSSTWQVIFDAVRSRSSGVLLDPRDSFVPLTGR